jgi:hypothetical protein
MDGIDQLLSAGVAKVVIDVVAVRAFVVDCSTLAGPECRQGGDRAAMLEPVTR